MDEVVKFNAAKDKEEADELELQSQSRKETR